MTKKTRCPCGKKIVPVFTIKDNTCGACRVESRRQKKMEPKLSWADVRAKRGALLSRTDWTQLSDQPKKVQDKWKPLRQELRDLTDHESPEEAWSRLKELEVKAQEL